MANSTMSPQAQPAAAERSDQASKPDAADDSPVFVEQLLRAGAEESPPGQLIEHDVLAWSGTAGTLSDGHTARTGFSCLVRPEPGDRVLVWPGKDESWVLAIMHRRSEQPAVISMSGNAALEASRLSLAAESVHIAAGDLLTSARNMQAVSDVHTETSRLRVTQVGTDVRRVGNADDAVEGTLLQRLGTWVSTTARDARLTARSFLFN